MVPSAWLRIFQPLDSFERAEELHWERYLLQRTAWAGRKPRYRDQRTSGALGLLWPADGEHAEVRVVDGRTYICPARTRMRTLAAALSWREARPMDLWGQFVPKKEARRAGRQLAKLRRRDPSAVAFSHQSPWHVPIRWFALFDDDERWLGEEEGGRLRLRYRTTVRRSMRRAEEKIPVLRRTDLGPIGELLLDLHQWMTAFDPISLLELDYGSLCDLMSWDELDDDRSVREVADALDAIEAGEYHRSAGIYEQILTRWAEVRSREVLN